MIAVLTYQGATEPWSPDMAAWSGDPVPASLVRASTPLQLQGAVVFQNKHCRNCHALDGIGGRRGPDLTSVGIRLTRDQLIDQVSNGTPGRRQHAGLWQADQAGRDERRWSISGQLAPAGSATSASRGDRPAVTTASPP